MTEHKQDNFIFMSLSFVSQAKLELSQTKQFWLLVFFSSGDGWCLVVGYHLAVWADQSAGLPEVRESL